MTSLTPTLPTLTAVKSDPAVPEPPAPKRSRRAEAEAELERALAQRDRIAAAQEEAYRHYLDKGSDAAFMRWIALDSQFHAACSAAANRRRTLDQLTGR
jgi:hypothetical protein